MAEKINLALIGAGRTGTPLLKELLKYPYINILGVADADPKAEGIKLAQEHGIPTSTDPMEVLKKGSLIDILVEVSGDPKLKKQIKDNFDQTHNTKTIIMHELIARLLISVCTQQDKLIPSFHPADIGIGRK